MATGKPSPKTYTLRLKYHKTTVLLHADPLTSLDVIKKDLLKVLKETNPNGMLHGVPLPSSYNQIRLARPNDVNDLTKGWEGIDPIMGDVDEVEESVKKLKLSDTLKGAGIREHAVMAFRFSNADTADDDMEDNEQWDVVIPSFDEPAEEE